MQRLLEVMRRLRAPDGCPWDREQTHESLRPYLLEEAAEAVDAVTHPDRLELASELGDVLLQVAFHSVIAEETGDFDYARVEGLIVDKLIRRHPHVFGDTSVSDSSEVVTNWNIIKAAERAGQPELHPAERVPRALGALARGTELHKALKRDKGSRATAQHALETASDDAAGVADALEAVIAWARGLGINPEVALRERLESQLQEAVRGT